MGFFKKIFKGVKRVFKKVGNFIKRTFKQVGKVFSKIGIVGTIALAVIAPYAIPALTSFAGTAAASSNLLVSGFGKMLGAGLKVASGVGKVVSSVSKAVTNTIGNVAKKVGGEFLNKMGIKNFMGKDLTKLDKWGDIWKQTQDSFAGVKNAWSAGTQEFQKNFDIAKINKQAESRSLLGDGINVGESTRDAVNEGAFDGTAGKQFSPTTKPTSYMDDALSENTTIVRDAQGNITSSISDVTAGTVKMKPAMTPVPQIDPFTGQTTYAEALNPTIMLDGQPSMLSRPVPPLEMPVPAKAASAAAPASGFKKFATEVGGEVKSNVKAGLVSAASDAILGTGTGDVSGQYGSQVGPVILPVEQVQGAPMIAINPLDPISNWAMGQAMQYNEQTNTYPGFMKA